MLPARRAVAIGAFFLAAAAGSLTAASQPRVAAIEIVSEDVIAPPPMHPPTHPKVSRRGRQTYVSDEEVRKVLPIKEGDVYDPATVEQALSYLKKWGRFAEVSVEKLSGGALLRFHLRYGFTVSGIDIYGTYPYLSARIRRMITVHSGDLFDDQLARDQASRIDNFYERQGYEGTEVRFHPKFNDAKRTVDLVYRVEKGGRHRVKNITIQGNTVFPSGYFVSQINPLLPYTPSRLRKSLEKIRKHYQDKGYLSARARLIDLGEDDSTKTVNPVIEIKEGKHVTVLFEGDRNRRISNHTLKKQMPMFTEGGYGSYDIDASAKAALDHYHRLGFQEASVSSEVEKAVGGNENEILVRFRIQEGPRTRVKKVEIVGNEEISDHRIKKELTTKQNTIFERGYYQPRTVERDFEKLPFVLNRHGALEGEALDHETELNRFHDKAHVTFTVQEGSITRVRDIQFEGNDHFAAHRLKRRLKLEEGNPYNAELMAQDKEALTVFYANKGYPYAAISAEMKRDGDQATLVYTIDEGTEVKIGEVLVVGNERTEPKAVERGMRIRKGQPFSYEKILLSEASLRRSGAFRSVNIQTIGLTEKEPVVHLVVKLEEYRKILVDFGATYSTDNFFTGDLNLSHVNLFGTIRRINLRFTGGRDIQKGQVIFKDPYFLGYPFETSLDFSLERDLKPGFKIVEGGGSLNFLREFNYRTTFLAKYQLTRTFFSDVTDATGLSESDHTVSKFSFSFNYDKRDSYADPHSGYTALVGVDVSNKLIASTFNFIQPRGFMAYYLPLGNRTTWINYARMEGIKVFGADNLTRDNKLFLGGDYSVRGFNEDSIGPIGTDGRPAGGQLLLTASSELQTVLFKNFKLAAFFDSGSLTDNFSQVGLDSFRHSAGVGLRYVTPVGPLRLDYGFKLDKKAGESIGRLHFAFGYAF